jgi:hypothetical protein
MVHDEMRMEIGGRGKAELMNLILWEDKWER